MIYRLSRLNIDTLLHKPETGMGYQLIEADTMDYIKSPLLVLNCTLVIETRSLQFPAILSALIKGDFDKTTQTFKEITLKNITLFEEDIQTFTLKEPPSTNKYPAKESKIEKANGDELFIRLSHFENDMRIDKKYKRLLPGSYTTTASDALRCKVEKDSPIERYSLPNELKIKWAFYFQPLPTDSLQKGWAKPDFNKRGGGREVYFENGTSNSTFITQSKWEDELLTTTK